MMLLMLLLLFVIDVVAIVVDDVDDTVDVVNAGSQTFFISSFAILSPFLQFLSSLFTIYILCNLSGTLDLGILENKNCKRVDKNIVKEEIKKFPSLTPC